MTGSGTVIGPSLVLTAAHVVFDENRRPLSDVWVGSPGRLFGARVLWPSTFDPLHGPLEWDAALLEITDNAWRAPSAAVAWGRVTGTQPGVPCSATGFPRAKLRATVTPTRGHQMTPATGGGLDRDSDQIKASINPGSNQVSGLYELDVESAIPTQLEGRPSPWSGASGAGVFANNLLIAVLLSDERHAYSGDRLCGLPIWRLATDDTFRAVVQAGGAGMGDVAEIRSVEAMGVLSPPVRLQSTRDRGSISPASLLRADAAIVPFHGQDRLVSDLISWCLRPGGADLRLLIGPGGQGKTRLARHLAFTLIKLGWDTVTAHDSSHAHAGMWLAGILESDPDRTNARDLSALADTSGPVLVIIDYAETRAGQVRALITSFEEHNRESAARILLLARAAGEWWTDLTDDLDWPPHRAIDLPGLRYQDISPSRGSAVKEGVAAGFSSALWAFAESLTLLKPGTDWTSAAERATTPADLEEPRYQSPLNLQMAALTALLESSEPLQGRTTSDSTEALLLRHERKYWRETARTSGVPFSAETLQDAVAVTTLAGASTRSEATTILPVVPGLVDATADAKGRISSWLRDLYPPDPGQWWGALQPDRVAEYHCARRLLNNPDVLPALLRNANNAQQRHALTVLARALSNPAMTHGDIAQLTTQLGGAIEGDIRAYGPVALEVATQTADPTALVGALRAVVDNATSAHLEVLSDSLPTESVVLASFAEHIASRLVSVNRATASTQEDIDSTARLAAALNNHAGRLNDLGRRREALQAISEAVTLRRQLVNTGGADFTPSLAQSLDRQSSCLAELGRRDDALAAITEAVALYRRLVDPLPAEFAAHLASALISLSNRWSALGKPIPALANVTEAITHLRRLRTADPERATDSLPRALINQSNILTNLARDGEALSAATQAVTFLRELATSNPDASNHLLTSALLAHSEALSNAGQQEESLEVITEAVTLGRELVARRPEAFTNNLAMALNNQSIALGRMDRLDEAEVAAREAINHYRPLYQQDPEAFGPDLAMALSTASRTLASTGRTREAITAGTEAVSRYRELAAVHPAVFDPKLTGALITLSDALGDFGEYDQALTLATEAVSLCRAHAAAQHETADPDLAIALNNLSGALGDVDRLADALAAITEAVDIRRRLAASRPRSFTAPLARALANQSHCLEALGQDAEALDASTAAVNILQDIAQTQPGALPQLAHTLRSQRRHLRAAGRYDEASQANHEALEVLCDLARDRPERHTPTLQEAASDLLFELADEGYDDERAVVTQLHKLFGTRAELILDVAMGGQSFAAVTEMQPALAAAAAVAQGRADTTTIHAVNDWLGYLGAQRDWNALVAAVRRVIDGERASDTMSDLDPLDTAIVNTLLALIETDEN